MPLQIRRGTEGERGASSQVLAVGEPLYTTDAGGRLYIGDGTTLISELLPITGYNDDSAQDAAAALFTEATHSNIEFVYNSAESTVTASLNLENYNGAIVADSFSGSIIQNDSTVLYDNETGLLFLNDRIASDISPNVDGIHDLGDEENRFNNLYLSGQIVSQSIVSDLVGSVFADDSTLMINAVNNTITAETVTANVVSGNLQGSLFGEDSSIIVDAVNSTIIAESVLTSSIDSNEDISITTADLLTINFSNPIPGPGVRIVSPYNQLINPSLPERFLNSKSLQFDISGESEDALSIAGFAPGHLSGAVSSKFTPIEESTIQQGFGFLGWATDENTITDPNITNIPTKFFILNTSNDFSSSNISPVISFDSLGRLGINTENALATLDVNGFAKLALLDSPPTTPSSGMIAIADGVNWNPASTGTETVVAYLNGNWVVLGNG